MFFLFWRVTYSCAQVLDKRALHRASRAVSPPWHCYVGTCRIAVPGPQSGPGFVPALASAARHALKPALIAPPSTRVPRVPTYLRRI